MRLLPKTFLRTRSVSSARSTGSKRSFISKRSASSKRSSRSRRSSSSKRSSSSRSSSSSKRSSSSRRSRSSSRNGFARFRRSRTDDEDGATYDNKSYQLPKGFDKFLEKEVEKTSQPPPFPEISVKMRNNPDAIEKRSPTSEERSPTSEKRTSPENKSIRRGKSRSKDKTTSRRRKTPSNYNRRRSRSRNPQPRDEDISCFKDFNELFSELTNLYSPCNDYVADVIFPVDKVTGNVKHANFTDASCAQMACACHGDENSFVGEDDLQEC